MAHTQFGAKILKQLIEELNGLAIVESPPKMEGRRMIVLLSPVSSKG